MKRFALALILTLTACGTPARIPVNPPTPTPAAVDIMSLLFSTNCRDIGGGTTVCDKREANGRIRRTTYTLNNHLGLNGEEIDTHSLYEIDPVRNCIAVVQEETRIHATGALQAIQIYGDTQNESPCWIKELSATSGGPEIDSGLHEFNWTWTHYDTTTGAQIGDAAHGRVSDRTRLTIPLAGNAQLIERYEDLADMTTFYCGVGSYSNPAPGGMITVKQDLGACK